MSLRAAVSIRHMRLQQTGKARIIVHRTQWQPANQGPATANDLSQKEVL